MPIRVIGVNGGCAYDIRLVVGYAAGLQYESGTTPVRKADIINLSLGGGACSLADQDVYDQARRAGTIIVAAAGNSASSAPSYPAAYDGVISVSATNSLNAPSSYSNYGAHIDVAAPGGDDIDVNGDGLSDGIASTDGDDSAGFTQFTYKLKMGTSMAAPHVSGVLALMKSVNPSLGPDDVDRIIARGDITRDLGAPGWDERFGYGLLDASLAANVAIFGATSVGQAQLATAPTSLEVVAGSTTRRLVIRDAGGGGLVVNEVSANQPWISITGQTIDDAGLGSYEVVVNQSSLEPGEHIAAITVRSSAGSMEVPVTASVDSYSVSSDVGLQHVILLDSSTSRVVDHQAVTAANGFYTYRFNSVASGSYRVRAGTDFDNDGVICDGGESCGEHASFDVSADVIGVDFVSGFGNNERRMPGGQPY